MAGVSVHNVHNIRAHLLNIVILIILTILLVVKFTRSKFLINIRDFKSEIRENENDGCGINDGIKPRWSRFSADDWNYIKKILDCMRVLHREKVGVSEIQYNSQLLFRSSLILTKLECTLSIKAMSDIFRDFDNIFMIGDSVLRQQFVCLICMLDVEVAGNRNSSITKDFTFKGEKFLANVTMGNNTSSSLNVEYIAWGQYFSEPNKLYPLLHILPSLLRNGSSRDLIVLNAGHHYKSWHAKNLTDHVSFIAQQACDVNNLGKSKPYIFFMETDEENFHTSNGMWAGDMCDPHYNCPCKELTTDAIIGNATLPPNVNWKAVTGLLQPDHSILKKAIYKSPWPGFFPELPIPFHDGCVPDCYPSFWRSAITIPIISNVSSKCSLYLVPIWRQLAARGIPNHIMPEDCMHKGVDVVIEMNLQLFRTILKAKRT